MPPSLQTLDARCGAGRDVGARVAQLSERAVAAGPAPLPRLQAHRLGDRALLLHIPRPPSHQDRFHFLDAALCN